MEHLPEGCSIYKKGELLAFILLSDNNRPHLIDLTDDGLIFKKKERKKERKCLKPGKVISLFLPDLLENSHLSSTDITLTSCHEAPECAGPFTF